MQGAASWCKYYRNCTQHGHWDVRKYGEICPMCSGKIGRKKQPKEKEDE